MGISYKITCDRCGRQYPEEIDLEIYDSSSFVMGANDVASKIRDNNWFITVDNKILCSICGVTKDLDTNEAVNDSTSWHKKALNLVN